jgi:hypothetical protein
MATPKWNLENMDPDVAMAYSRLFRRWLDENTYQISSISILAPAVIRAGVPESIVIPLLKEADAKLRAKAAVD